MLRVHILYAGCVWVRAAPLYIFQCHKARTFYLDFEMHASSHMELTLFTIQIYSFFYFNSLCWTPSFCSPALVREQFDTFNIYTIRLLLLSTHSHNHVKRKQNTQFLFTRTRPNCKQHFPSLWHNSHWKLKLKIHEKNHRAINSYPVNFAPVRLHSKFGHQSVQKLINFCHIKFQKNLVKFQIHATIFSVDVFVSFAPV